MKGNKLFLNTQKSGTPVYVPLPPAAVKATSETIAIREQIMKELHWDDIYYEHSLQVMVNEGLAAASNKAGDVRFLELKKLADREPGDKEMEAFWELTRANDKAILSYLVADVGHTVVNLIAFVNLFRSVV